MLSGNNHIVMNLPRRWYCIILPHWYLQTVLDVLPQSLMFSGNNLSDISLSDDTGVFVFIIVTMFCHLLCRQICVVHCPLIIFLDHWTVSLIRFLIAASLSLKENGYHWVYTQVYVFLKIIQNTNHIDVIVVFCFCANKIYFINTVKIKSIISYFYCYFLLYCTIFIFFTLDNIIHYFLWNSLEQHRHRKKSHPQHLILTSFLTLFATSPFIIFNRPMFNIMRINIWYTFSFSVPPEISCKLFC